MMEQDPVDTWTNKLFKISVVQNNMQSTVNKRLDPFARQINCLQPTTSVGYSDKRKLSFRKHAVNFAESNVTLSYSFRICDAARACQWPYLGDNPMAMLEVQPYIPKKRVFGYQGLSGDV